MKLPTCSLIFFGVYIFMGDILAAADPISGFVLDEKGRPLPEAVVRIQTTETTTVTDSEGRFTLELNPSKEAVLTAWKEGYLNGRLKPTPDRREEVFRLKPVPPGDNKGYRWISPNPPAFFERLDIAFWKGVASLIGNEELNSRFNRNCSNCHASFTVAQWRQDAHSGAARNPLLLGMYNGTDFQGRPGVFPGYKLDFPNSKGNCANCHAPVQALLSPEGADLNETRGIAREGIFCDFCHKIKEVELRPGRPGILSIQLNRPSEGRQVFYGPYDDVTSGPDTFSPVYRESRFCAPCHSATFWGVPIYSEFDEWLKSPYAREGTECQDCHMAPDGKTTRFVPEEKGGLQRDPKTIATHYNRGSRDVRFLSDAIKMELKADHAGDVFDVTVMITNQGAGHDFPTGIPMRNMILWVEALNARGERLTLNDGSVVPEWGGVGSPDDGNYAGLPGKGFAKVLADQSRNFPAPNPDYKSPTPHWRQAVILTDNRIPPKETDVSHYRFRRDRADKGGVQIRARLLYRRAFKPWIDAKGWPLKDLEIAREDVRLSP